MSDTNSIKAKLIKEGVKKLRWFGFLNANENNINSDEVYKLYFWKMLETKIGQNKLTDKVIGELMKNKEK